MMEHGEVMDVADVTDGGVRAEGWRLSIGGEEREQKKRPRINLRGRSHDDPLTGS